MYLAAFLRFLVAAVPPETRINIVVHVALCVPDVGLCDFLRWFPGVLTHTERITLYASNGDTEFVTSKWLHLEQRAGDANPPVVIAGVETIDCSDIDFDFMGHSYYGSNVDMLSGSLDLFAALKQQHRADQRPYLK